MKKYFLTDSEINDASPNADHHQLSSISSIRALVPSK